jgi:mRNA interferase MazF
MKQGEIWLANLDPIKGHEQSGKRPVLIVSGNALNDHMPILWVIPITSKVKNYKGHPILNPHKENGLKEISEVMIFQLKAISKDRLIKKMGIVAQETLNQCKMTINNLLDY